MSNNPWRHDGLHNALGCGPDQQAVIAQDREQTTGQMLAGLSAPARDFRMKRLYCVQVTLYIGAADLGDMLCPAGSNDVKDYVVQQGILAGCVQQECRFQGIRVWAHSKRCQLRQDPVRRVPTCQSCFDDLDDRPARLARTLRQRSVGKLTRRGVRVAELCIGQQELTRFVQQPRFRSVRRQVGTSSAPCSAAMWMCHVIMPFGNRNGMKRPQSLGAKNRGLICSSQTTVLR